MDIIGVKTHWGLSWGSIWPYWGSLGVIGGHWGILGPHNRHIRAIWGHIRPYTGLFSRGYGIAWVWNGKPRGGAEKRSGSWGVLGVCGPSLALVGLFHVNNVDRVINQIGEVLLQLHTI